ncbi:MAG: hypothetical protein AAGF84_10195 [Planctomycetota bacterium]
MSLFDVLFPNTAAAMHLRKLSNAASDGGGSPQLRIEQLEQAATTEALKVRIDELESDLGFVVLVLSSVLSALDEKGSLSRDELAKELRELDIIDGRTDGQLSTTILKHYFASPDGGTATPGESH